MEVDNVVLRRFGFIWTLLAASVALSQVALHYDSQAAMRGPYWPFQYLIAALGIASGYVLVDRRHEREGEYFFPATGVLKAILQWGANIFDALPRLGR